MISKPLKTSPTLLTALEKARGHVLTRTEKDVQRKSWDVTREYAEKVYADIVGN